MQIFFYFFEFFLFFGDHDTGSSGYQDTKCPSERDALPIHSEDRGVMEKGV